MGRVQNYAFRRYCTSGHLVISLALLLISALTQDASMAQGRQIMTNTLEPVKALDLNNEDKNVTETSLIGSRPPRCKTRCKNCGHCEAIQVPIAPQQKLKPAERRRGGTHSLQNSTPITEYSREDSSNYKPMSWRCKCGDFIFNP